MDSIGLDVQKNVITFCAFLLIFIIYKKFSLWLNMWWKTFSFLKSIRFEVILTTQESKIQNELNWALGWGVRAARGAQSNVLVFQMSVSAAGRVGEFLPPLNVPSSQPALLYGKLPFVCLRHLPKIWCKKQPLRRLHKSLQ